MGGYEERVGRVGGLEEYEGMREKRKKKYRTRKPKPKRFITFFSLARVPLLEPKNQTRTKKIIKTKNEIK